MWLTFFFFLIQQEVLSVTGNKTAPMHFIFLTPPFITFRLPTPTALIPIEMPGPPTNIAISNISPRSVTLQFKPGYDGKTSISRWLVEAQVAQSRFTFENLPWFVAVVVISGHWFPSFCPLFHVQIGVIGENEEWVMVHQLSNEPDARSLEVEGLNPYTYYRFIHCNMLNFPM